MKRTKSHGLRMLQIVDEVMGVGYRPTLRTAAGARHSAADQAHLDAARVHLDAAGASPEAMTQEDLDAAAAMARKDLPPGHGSMSANERYQAMLSGSFASLRAASKRVERENAAARRLSAPRQLEAADAIPDGYRTALANREQFTPSDITPDLWPGYDRLHPPDGYRMALALTQITKEAR